VQYLRFNVHAHEEHFALLSLMVFGTLDVSLQMSNDFSAHSDNDLSPSNFSVIAVDE